MSVVWKLKSTTTGVERTLEEILVRDLTRTVINQGAGTVKVDFGWGTMLTEDPWPDRAEIQVLRDGVVWFRGYNILSEPSAAGAAAGFVITLADAWWYLEQVVYTQTLTFVTDGSQNPAPASSDGLVMSDFTTEEKSSSTIFLNEDESGEKVSTTETIRTVLEYAISKGVPLQIGTIDSGVEVGKEERKGSTCAEIIKRCLVWNPDFTVNLNYTTSPTTINVRKRSNRSAYTLAVTDATIAEIAITERRDQVLDGVRIEYVRDHAREDFTFRTIEYDDAGNVDGLRTLIFPVELYGSYLVNGSLVAEEATPTGVAQAFYDNWDSPKFEGRVILRQQDCPDVAWLSKVLRVTGGNVKWATMDSDIQTVVDTVSTGQTEITIGPPNQLGIQDMVELIRDGRTESPSFDEALTHTGGGSPKVSKVPATTEDPRIEFDLNHPPQVVVKPFEYYFQGTPASGWYTIHRFHWDFLDVYTTIGGTYVGGSGRYNNWDKRGSIVNVGGFSVGYSSGMTTLGSPGVYPAGCTSPQYVTRYVAYQDTGLITSEQWDTGGGYLNP